METESDSKAELFHAKYLHDLELGNGAKSVKLAEYPCFEVDAQGFIVTARKGSKFRIIASNKLEGILDLLKRHEINSTWAFETDLEIPMYITAWNDFPFRFYYWFDQYPPGTDPENYRFLPEFDWAREQGTGFVDWVNIATNDTAEGLAMLNGITWAIRAAGRRGLPVVINTSLTNNQSGNTSRFAKEVQRGMPDFVGSFYCVADPSHAGVRELSWGSQAGKDAILASLQNVARETVDYPNVIEYLEPHGELRHANHDMYLEYGPIADESFRDYLKKEYDNSLEKVSERWYGNPEHLKSWDEVSIPEIASFAGWNENSLDLKGSWKITFEPSPGDPPQDWKERETWERKINAPKEWFEANFDDSDWPEIPAPGHDRIMFVHNRKPAVFRRTFEVNEEYLSNKERIWIYVWDLNRAHGKPQQVWINGKLLGEQIIPHPRNNVMVFEAKEALKAGENQVSIRVSEGFLEYKVYLSPVEPRSYPMLSPEENRRWVDFAGWWRFSRIDAVRRGMEMIREIEPDRGIVCMSPYGYFAGIRELCTKYGGHFHDTGGMSGGMHYNLQGMMRSAGLPCTLEPGGPAGSPEELRRFSSLWAMEGINAVHYFIHIGSVFWNPEIKALFEELKPQLKFMGKHHVPRAEIASLMDDRIGNLTDFPLIGDHNAFIKHDPGRWSFNEYILQEYRLDNLTLYDFESETGENLKHYDTVLDTNCSILSENQIDAIENWIREGGLFVTHVQTGRHLPDVADAWPISRLSGYKVVHVDPHDERGEAKWRKFDLAEDQSVFATENWPERLRSGNGLSLVKDAPECIDLLYWEDGTVAAGLRPLGKGCIIQLGVKFSNHIIWWGNGESLKTALLDILKWRGKPTLPVRSEGVKTLHSVTNDQLFDVWTLGNIDRDPCVTKIVFTKDVPENGELYEITGDKTWKLERWEDGTASTGEMNFERNQTRIFIAPRNRIADGSLAWLNQQRDWWQGAWKPGSEAKKLPPPPQDNTLDLNSDWSLLPLEEGVDPIGFIATDFDYSSWKKGKPAAWIVPEDSVSKRRIFRKKFKVPENWASGIIELMFQGMYDNPFTARGNGRLWIDGKEYERFNRGVRLENVEVGKTYEIAIFCEGRSDLCGPSGNIWLSRIPDPCKTFDLSGEWRLSNDGLRWSEETVNLPGEVPEGTSFAKRKFECPEFDPEKTQVYIRFETSERGLTGLLINGRYLRRHHHDLSERTFLNITPWLEPGSENELELNGRTGRNQVLKSVRLDFYDAESF